jgi:hypothetical protein
MVRLGKCHLCGTDAELTFEHVPPKAAFNNRALLRQRGDMLLTARSRDELRSVRAKREPRGAGAFTLCAPCNNNTGKWYGEAYVDWTYQALTVSEKALVAPSLYYNFHIFPMRVVKQIACMFFSANGPEFQSVQNHTVRFVLNRHLRYLDPNFRIYAYFNRSPLARQAGTTGVIRGLGTSSSEILTYSEISFPPLGYILSLNGKPPHPDLCDISFFGRYGYNEWTDVTLRIPVLPVASPYPGDFRREDEMFGR